MSFDKTKAMRSAERYLSQGKIRAAIEEYKLVVDNDAKDINTLNMLGDLYVKNKDKTEALRCFTRVAEYYVKQGFSQKAIAVYNKISRLQPDSTDVSARLAELYQAKGAVAEARTHYVALADQYQRGGKKMEALSIWKQIAELDPSNAEVYLKIAESYWQEKQKDEAAEAFTIAGARLSAQGKFEAALTAFSRALEIHQHDFNALNGYVKAQINLGYADEAAKTLENVLEQQPYNRDILYLLADCHLETNNPEEAERAVVKLIEQEPANYPKYLELVELYLKNQELDAAARILSVSSEHLLVGGQSEEFLKWTNEILARNPEHLAALRLLVRYCGWNRDTNELKTALERLAESAVLAGSIEDEKTALSQLAQLSPNETESAERLREISGGTSPEELQEILAAEDVEFLNSEEDSANQNLTAENYPAAGSNETENNHDQDEFQNGFEFITAESEKSVLPENSGTAETSGKENFAFQADGAENGSVKAVNSGKNSKSAKKSKNSNQARNLSTADGLRFEKEIESIRFYIEQEYHELAFKSLHELENEFGSRSEISDLRNQIGGGSETDLAGNYDGDPQISETAVEFHSVGQVGRSEPEIVEISSPDTFAEKHSGTDQSGKNFYTAEIQNNGFFDDFRSDLGLEESEPAPDDDYDTHFQMAIAYSEMGLAEEAIREFQDAINIVSVEDGTRRFFQCAHLLGNCFMEKQMPHLALLWYQRALETSNLNIEEKQGIWYELGSAHQAGGDAEKALENFEKIYAIDVDYRDIKERVQNLLVHS